MSVQQRNDLVAEWVESANADLAWARMGASMADLPGSAQIGFHAQQAVEKMLKAYLAMFGIEAENHHNLGRLVHQIRTLDRFTAAQLSDVHRLTQYAVYLRYPARPGSSKVMPSRDEIVSDVQIAEHACAHVEQVIGEFLQASPAKSQDRKKRAGLARR